MSQQLIIENNSWSEFVQAMESFDNKQRGNAFELLTELYLQADPVYRTKLKNVWHLTNIPQSVRTKIGLPIQDIGVDLVAESYDGDFWAIQCKYHHDPIMNITRNEINSFITTTQVVCKGKFGVCLVVSTANDYSRILDKHYVELQYCLGDKFTSLGQDFFKQGRALLKKQVPKITPRKPRPHQKKAIKNALAYFVKRKESRGKLIHPCGTGKSLIGYWISDALEAKKIIVALPSLYLVRQTIADWTRESVAKQISIDWIVVCSEKTISDSSRDDPAMRFHEMGVEVTTKPEDIAVFLKRRTPNKKKVVFTTYQSGEVTGKASMAANFTFDLGIFDEAHKTVGLKDKLFSKLLYEKNIKIKKRVFMTATERQYRGDSDNVDSMDDIDVYGDTFDKMTFKEALDEKNSILCDYKIVTTIITRSDIQQLVDKNLLVKPDKGKWDSETEAKTLASLIALRKAMKKYKAYHALTFHNSIAKAKAFADSLERFDEATKEYGKVDTYHVSSNVSTAKRKVELNKFADSKKAVVTNARCLTEGIDIPKIDAILFTDPKRSVVDIVQAAGRALRPADGKKKGYIIVPVLVDPDNPDNTDEAYQDILLVLRAMASNDDRIIEYFRTIYNGKKSSKKIDVIDIEIADPKDIKLQSFVDNIKDKAWDRLAKLSWRPFEEARDFVRQLDLSGQQQWINYCKEQISNKPIKPQDIPANPQRVYKNLGWSSLGDWLGTGVVATQQREYCSFIEARKFAHSLNLTSEKQWRAYAAGKLKGFKKKPNIIPAHVHEVYRNNGWVNWPDWLGTDYKPKTTEWLSFEKAKEFVHKLKLNGSKDWHAYCKGGLKNKGEKPINVPSNPQKTYRNTGWVSMGDWTGTGRVNPNTFIYLPYEEAKEFVHNLNIKTLKEWKQYCRGEIKNKPKKPDNIPSNFRQTYLNSGYSTSKDWLGHENISNSERSNLFWDYTKARSYVRKLKIKSQTDWFLYTKGKLKGFNKKPQEIPVAPNSAYNGNGWVDWSDWLGTGRLATRSRKNLPFNKAREFARSLELESGKEWRLYCSGKMKGKKPKLDGLPTNVWRTYKDSGWAGMQDWLGYKKPFIKINDWRDYKKARAYVHELNIKNQAEWFSLAKSKKLPDDIPKSPAYAYKDKGWISWPDWLGKK